MHNDNQNSAVSSKYWMWQLELGVALTGRNRTGPPCSVGRSSAHAPSVTDDDRRQQAKQYWPIRRASNNGTACN